MKHRRLMALWPVSLLLLWLLVTGCSGVEPAPLATAWERIDQGALVIDVRTPPEYERGHLPMAHLLPYAQIANRIEAVVTDRDRPIVLYCHSGRRSGIAAATLQEMGYRRVINAGGLAALVTHRQQQRQSAQ